MLRLGCYKLRTFFLDFGYKLFFILEILSIRDIG